MFQFVFIKLFNGFHNILNETYCHCIKEFNQRLLNKNLNVTKLAFLFCGNINVKKQIIMMNSQNESM